MTTPTERQLRGELEALERAFSPHYGIGFILDLTVTDPEADYINRYGHTPAERDGPLFVVPEEAEEW
jgi:hypothetical protein